MTYEFRKLGATDVFPMLRIIKAIGLNRFTACFQNEEIQAIVAGATAGENVTRLAGTAVMLEVGQVLIEGLDRCEEDIFKLLASASGLSVKAVKAMDMGEFIEMIIAFVKKEEFRDFFEAVSKLLK